MVEGRCDLSCIECWVQRDEYSTKLEQSICDCRELDIVSQLDAYPVSFLHP